MFGDILSDERISIKSTKENDDSYSQLYCDSDYFIPKNEEEKNKRFTKVLFQVFSNNKNLEFDDISYDKNNENENTNINLLGKKHLQESSFINFTQIYKAEKNETKEKIFQISKIICKNDAPVYRLDYYKKIFIKSFLKYLLNYGKKLISLLNFEEQIIGLKLHMPNYKLYAGNPKEKDNREFLKKTIKTVFMDYDKENENGTSRQKDNEKLIKKIYELIKIPTTENENNVIDFFEMTIEKGIEMFYVSEEFKLFKNDKLNQYYDDKFYNEKNRKFSLIYKNAFIRLANMPFYSKFPK